MKHTKNKWTINWIGRGSFFQIISDEKAARSIAQLDPHFDHDGPAKFSFEEAEANAKLIATAPELLEALKHLSETFKAVIVYNKLNPTMQDNGAYNLALKTIEKATK